MTSEKIARRLKEVVASILKALECAICLDILQDPVSTNCRHNFCRSCITRVLHSTYQAPCPLCKAPVTKRSLNQKDQLKHVVNAAKKLAIAVKEDTGLEVTPPKGPQSTSTSLGTRDMHMKLFNLIHPSPLKSVGKQKLLDDQTQGNCLSHKAYTITSNARNNTKRKTNIHVEDDSCLEKDATQPQISTNINIHCGFPVQKKRIKLYSDVEDSDHSSCSTKTHNPNHKRKMKKIQKFHQSSSLIGKKTNSDKHPFNAENHYIQLKNCLENSSLCRTNSQLSLPLKKHNSCSNSRLNAVKNNKQSVNFSNSDKLWPENIPRNRRSASSKKDYSRKKLKEDQASKSDSEVETVAKIQEWLMNCENHTSDALYNLDSCQNNNSSNNSLGVSSTIENPNEKNSYIEDNTFAKKGQSSLPLSSKENTRESADESCETQWTLKKKCTEDKHYQEGAHVDIEDPYVFIASQKTPKKVKKKQSRQGKKVNKIATHKIFLPSDRENSKNIDTVDKSYDLKKKPLVEPDKTKTRDDYGNKYIANIEKDSSITHENDTHKNNLEDFQRTDCIDDDDDVLLFVTPALNTNEMFLKKNVLKSSFKSTDDLPKVLKPSKKSIRKSNFQFFTEQNNIVSTQEQISELSLKISEAEKFELNVAQKSIITDESECKEELYNVKEKCTDNYNYASNETPCHKEKNDMDSIVNKVHNNDSINFSSGIVGEKSVMIQKLVECDAKDCDLKIDAHSECLSKQDSVSKISVSNESSLAAGTSNTSLKSFCWSRAKQMTKDFNCRQLSPLKLEDKVLNFNFPASKDKIILPDPCKHPSLDENNKFEVVNTDKGTLEVDNLNMGEKSMQHEFNYRDIKDCAHESVNGMCSVTIPNGNEIKECSSVNIPFNETSKADIAKSKEQTVQNEDMEFLNANSISVQPTSASHLSLDNSSSAVLCTNSNATEHYKAEQVENSDLPESTTLDCVEKIEIDHKTNMDKETSNFNGTSTNFVVADMDNKRTCNKSITEPVLHDTKANKDNSLVQLKEKGYSSLEYDKTGSLILGDSVKTVETITLNEINSVDNSEHCESPELNIKDKEKFSIKPTRKISALEMEPKDMLDSTKSKTLSVLNEICLTAKGEKTDLFFGEKDDVDMKDFNNTGITSNKVLKTKISLDFASKNETETTSLYDKDLMEGDCYKSVFSSTDKELKKISNVECSLMDSVPMAKENILSCVDKVHIERKCNIEETASSINVQNNSPKSQFMLDFASESERNIDSFKEHKNHAVVTDCNTDISDGGQNQMIYQVENSLINYDKINSNCLPCAAGTICTEKHDKNLECVLISEKETDILESEKLTDCSRKPDLCVLELNNGMNCVSQNELASENRSEANCSKSSHIKDIKSVYNNICIRNREDVNHDNSKLNETVLPFESTNITDLTKTECKDSNTQLETNVMERADDALSVPKIISSKVEEHCNEFQPICDKQSQVIKENISSVISQPHMINKDEKLHSKEYKETNEIKKFNISLGDLAQSRKLSDVLCTFPCFCCTSEIKLSLNDGILSLVVFKGRQSLQQRTKKCKLNATDLGIRTNFKEDSLHSSFEKDEEKKDSSQCLPKISEQLTVCIDENHLFEDKNSLYNIKNNDLDGQHQLSVEVINEKILPLSDSSSLLSTEATQSIANNSKNCGNEKSFENPSQNLDINFKSSTLQSQPEAVADMTGNKPVAKTACDNVDTNLSIHLELKAQNVRDETDEHNSNSLCSNDHVKTSSINSVCEIQDKQMVSDDLHTEISDEEGYTSEEIEPFLYREKKIISQSNNNNKVTYDYDIIEDSNNYSSDPDMLFAESLVAPLKEPVENISSDYISPPSVIGTVRKLPGCKSMATQNSLKMHNMEKNVADSCTQSVIKASFPMFYETSQDYSKKSGIKKNSPADNILSCRNTSLQKSKSNLLKKCKKFRRIQQLNSSEDSDNSSSDSECIISPCSSSLKFKSHINVLKGIRDAKCANMMSYNSEDKEPISLITLSESFSLKESQCEMFNTPKSMARVIANIENDLKSCRKKTHKEPYISEIDLANSQTSCISAVNNDVTCSSVWSSQDVQPTQARQKIQLEIEDMKERIRQMECQLMKSSEIKNASQMSVSTRKKGIQTIMSSRDYNTPVKEENNGEDSDELFTPPISPTPPVGKTCRKDRMSIRRRL